MRERITNLWARFTVSRADAQLAFEWNGLVKFIPLILCGGFFTFSTVWLVVGPLDWHISNLPVLYTFLAACLLALSAGYLYGVGRRQPRRFQMKSVGVINANRTMIFAGIVALALYFPTVFATTGSWLPDVWGGLTHAATAYHTTKSLNDTSSPVIFYVRFLLSPLLILMAPLTYFLWPRLSWAARVLGIMSITGTVALSIAQGINKGMADATAYSCLFLALIAASSLRKGQGRRLLGAVVGGLLVSSLFLGYYATNIHSRIASDAQKANSSEQTSTTPRKGSTSPSAPSPQGSTPPESNPPASDAEVAKMLDAEVALGGAASLRKDHFVNLLPGGLRTSVLVLSSYVTHPYRGLSMALAETWTPTYGLGFSEFLRHNISKVLGGQTFEDKVKSNTYAGKISAEGWPVGQVWATFFIDPASDLSFPGVVFLMGLIGFFFAAAWRETVSRGDPLAAGVFYSLCALVFYLPANNQLFQGGETAVGFSVIFLAWIVVRTGRANRVLHSLQFGVFAANDDAAISVDTAVARMVK